MSRPTIHRSYRFVPLGIATALVMPSAASLADDSRPATWDMSVEELEAIGLGQSRGDPVPVPADAPREGAPVRPQAGGSPGVIFVNFDGGQLGSGWDNSKNNTTQISQLVGSFAAYGQGAKRDAVLQAVIEDWAPFNVVITDTRPASGDYTMNMTGPTNPFGGGVLGIAPLDCNDSQTHNNITFAFHSVNDSFSAAVTATTIGQEVAHSYGLEHVNEPGDIMNPYNAGGNASFIDQCIAIVQSVSCGGQHQAVCGQSNMQNSYQELMNLFGPGVPDTAQPIVSITSPQDGAVFDEGASFTISAQASDDVGVESIKLYNNGTYMASDASEPYDWDVSNIPAGTYELYVEASDLAGNVAVSDVVTVTVGAPPSDDGGPSLDDGGGGDADPAGDGDAGDDAGANDDDGDDDMGDDDDDDALPAGFGQERGASEGCACTTGVGVGGGGFAPWLAFVLVPVCRRRRAR